MATLSFSELENMTSRASVWTAVGATAGVGLEPPRWRFDHRRRGRHARRRDAQPGRANRCDGLGLAPLLLTEIPTQVAIARTQRAVQGHAR
jgi:hypothetical protein